MTIRQRRGALLALLLAVAWSARAADEAAVVKRATKLLEEIASDPDSGIPARYLREARGIVILPGLVETQLGVGRKKGHGVFLSRDEKGEWGDVRPVEVSGTSVGAIAGREVTDMVILYRTRKAAEDYGKDNVSLAAYAHFLASRNRRHKFDGPGPDSKTEKDALTYTRNKGFVLGAAMGGEHRWGRRGKGLGGVEGFPHGDRTSGSPEARPRPAADSPEAGRLKAVLAAMTSQPTAPIAEAGMKDPKVRPAG